MKSKELFAKLFVSHRYFTIALRPRQENTILAELTFAPKHIVPATPAHWYADPILVDDGDKTWLFYEAVVNDHGHIEVAQVLDDCTLGEPKMILRDDCHYSYPFVFRHEGSWYMIPESSASGQVRLYRATAFPEKWEPVTILLQEKAVDTTVFAHKDQLYLLTYLPDSATERVTPRAYRLTIREEVADLSPIPWEHHCSLRVRGAGPLFVEEGVLYRPAQISQEQRYGDGLVFYRLAEPGETYLEGQICHMDGDGLDLRGIFADGLHTYCRSRRFEAIDIRCGKVDYLKLLKKLFRK